MGGKDVATLASRVGGRQPDSLSLMTAQNGKQSERKRDIECSWEGGKAWVTANKPTTATPEVNIPGHFPWTRNKKNTSGFMLIASLNGTVVVTITNTVMCIEKPNSGELGGSGG